MIYCPFIRTTAQDFTEQGIGVKVIAGQGAEIDTTTASSKLVFGIFAALAKFERELIREHTKASLQVRLAETAMQNRDTKVSELCGEPGVTRSTLYRYVGSHGELREHGERVLGLSNKRVDRASPKQPNPSTEARSA